MSTNAAFTNVTGDMAQFAIYTAGATDEIVRVNLALEYNSTNGDSVNIQTVWTDDIDTKTNSSFEQTAIHTFTVKLKAGTSISVGTLTSGPTVNYSFYVVLDTIFTL